MAHAKMLKQPDELGKPREKPKIVLLAAAERPYNLVTIT